MTNITGPQYFKKRWLYFLSLFFIYVIPLLMVLEKFLRMDPVPKYAKFSFSGLVLGIVYIAFISKKAKKKIDSLKPGSIKIFLTGLTNIIPFLIVGFLVVLVESVLKGFDITAFAICVFMAIGTIIQIIEFNINRKFLYDLIIEEMAREQVDVEYKKKELIEEKGRLRKCKVKLKQELEKRLSER